MPLISATSSAWKAAAAVAPLVRIVAVDRARAAEDSLAGLRADAGEQHRIERLPRRFPGARFAAFPEREANVSDQAAIADVILVVSRPDAMVVVAPSMIDS
jgi:hypothetical protein